MEVQCTADKFAEMVTFGMQKCPFLRNIAEPTSFNFFRSNQAFAPDVSQPVSNNPRESGRLSGPIFEDGPSFDVAFRLFHGSNGVVPLSKASIGEDTCPHMSASSFSVKQDSLPDILASSAATISLSAFGPLGPFSYDSFRAANEKRKKAEESDKKRKLEEEQKAENAANHEALGSEWLASGNCPLAKSYRAINGMLPLVAKIMTPPPGMKYKCPPAIVAARAALAKNSAVKALRPQLLPVKVLAIGLLGMGLNMPLGVWREHCEKFSPQWIIAVHAAVPFIAMLRKAVLLPKYAMVFTIASCIIGQGIGARFERKRLKDSGGSAIIGLPPLKQRKKKNDSDLGVICGSYTGDFPSDNCANFKENSMIYHSPTPVSVY